MAEEYKILLGVQLKDEDIQTQINEAQKHLKPIEIKVDAETKELTNTIRDALKSLTSGTKNALTLDTTKIEGSLKDVATTIKDIKASLGSLDSGKGTKSLLSSVNQISTALEKASNQFAKLNAELKTLSSKDFSVNVGLNMGGSNPIARNAAYGNKVRNETLPQLKKQAEELESYLKQYYKVADGFNAAQKLIQGSGAGKGKANLYDLLPKMLDSTGSLSSQMTAFKEYIALIKEAASIKGIDIDAVTSGFSQSADKLVQDAQDVQTGAKEMQEAFKNLFGTSIDADGLTKQLDSIVVDLGEIKTSIQSLSSNNSIDGLTQSFNRLSETLEKLTANLTLAKNTLDTGFYNTAPANNAVKVAQQTGQKIGEAVGKSVAQSAKQSINLDDVIDEQVSALMNEYAIVGGKGSKAFDKIRQSLVDFRNGSGDINKVTSAISNNMKVVNEAKNDYKDLAEYIKMFNASGAKVHIPDSIKQEYGDDYKTMRSQLGKGFTSGQGMDFETFVVELNSILGQTIDLSHGAEAAFGDLVRKVNSTKGGKFLTGDDLFRSGVLDMGDVIANVSTSLERIENVEEEIARASTISANVVVQNEERKQQAYRETANEFLAVQKGSFQRAFSPADEEFGGINNTAKSVEEYFKSINGVLSDTVSVQERFDADKNLNGFTVSLKNANGAAEQLRYTLRTIEDTGDAFFEYTGGSISDNGVLKQMNTISAKADTLQNKLSKLKSEYSDVNAAKPIKDADHISELSKQYEKVEKAILDVRNADESTFASMVSNAEKEKTALENMVRKFRNAENVASQMKSADYDSARSIAEERYNKLLANAKGFDLDTSKLDLDNVTDVASLNKFTDALRVAEAQLGRLKAEVKEVNEAYKQIYDAQKRIGSLEVDLIGAKAKDDVKTIDAINDEITRLKKNISSLDADGVYSSKFTEKQKADLKELNELIEYSKKQAQNNIEYKLDLDKAKTEVKEVNEAYKQMLEMRKQIHSLSIEEKNLTELGNTNELNEVSAKLKDLKSDYEALNRVFGSKLTFSQFGTLQAEIDETESELKQLDAKWADTKAKLANKIKLNLGDDGKFAYQVEDMRTKVNSLSGEFVDSREKLKALESAFDAMSLADEQNDIKGLTKSYEEFKVALEKVNLQYKKDKSAQDKNISADKLNQQKKALSLDMKNWLTDNSAATRRFGDTIQELQIRLKSCSNDVDFGNIRREFQLIQKEAKELGLTTQTLGDQIKSKFKQYSAYFSVAEVFMYAEQALRDMFQQVLAIDTAMTELKKVTDETDASYNRFLSNAASRAKEIGTTIDGLVTSTADFARLGYSFKESQGLAEVANIYAVVGDDIDSVESATQSLVSTLTAFKDEANGLSDSDFALSIVDKMNEVSNNFAISSGGIGGALQRSASSMMAANNSLDETIALITAANTVVQDPDSVGTAFKTISMRIRGAKTELEEAGLETDGMVESTAKLREEIFALSGVDIMLDNSTFKSTYQIMEELAAKWQDLTDIQQASVTELIAGKRQGNIVSSLMNNFDIAEEALKTSLGSSGSAMAEHSKYMESMEAKLSQLKATWQSFAQTFMSSDFLKGGIDALKTLVSILDELVNNFGLLGTVGLGTGITGLFKSFKSIVTEGDNVVETVTNIADAMDDVGDVVRNASSAADLLDDIDLDDFDNSADVLRAIYPAADEAAEGMLNLSNATGKTTGGFKAFMKTPLGVASAIGAVVAVIGLAINAYKNYREEQSKLRQETIASSNEFLESATSFEQAYIKYSGRTDLTTDEEAELEAAINGTVDALDDKSSALQDVVNSSNDYVASLERIADAELEEAERAAKAKRDNAKTELEEVAMGYSSHDSEVNISLGGGKETEIAKEIGNKFFKQEKKNSFTMAAGEAFSTEYEVVGLELPSNATINQIVDYYYTLLDYQEALSDAELGDSAVYERVSAAIDKMTDSVETYTSGVFEATKAEYQLAEGIPRTTDEYLAMREAILKDADIAGLSLDARKSFANTLDSQYGQSFDLSTAEVQARKLIGILDEYGDTEAGQMETFLNMRTAVNNNECSVGEYLSQLDDIGNMTADWSDGSKEEFELTFGIDADKVKEQYDDMYNYISRNYIGKIDYGELEGLTQAEKNIYKEMYKDGIVENKSNEIQNFLDSLSASELSALMKIRTEIDWESGNFEDSLKQIEKQVKIDEALSFEADIKVDTEALEILNEALTESASAMGLSSEAIDNLKAKYSKLEGYDAATLFEATANGVKVNRRELEKLEDEYNNLTKTEVKEHLDTLAGEYNRVTAEIDKCSNAGERAQLISERETYADKIEELATYQAQLEGVTGAYQEWINAQNTPEDYEGYEAVATGREDVEDEIERGFIGNSTKKYIDLLSGQDLDGKSVDDYANAWEKLDDKVTGAGYSINDFFTVNDDGDITATGIDRFFKSLQTDFEGSVAKFDKKTKKWTYDFGTENLEKIQEKWGIGVEAIELLLEAAASAGYDIDWDGILDGIDLDTSNFETLVSTAEAAQTAFNKLEGVEDVDFNFTCTGVEQATSELEKAKNTYIDLITNDDGSINLKAEGAAEMRIILSTLLIQKQQLEDSNIAINIDTSGLDESQQDIANAINAVKNFREKYKNLEIAVTTGQGIEEAKTELNTAMTELQGLGDAGVDIAAELILGEGATAESLNSKVDAAISAVGSKDIKVGCKLDETDLGSLNSQVLANFTPEATVKITGIDDSLVGEYTSTEKTANGKVKWSNDDSLVVAFQGKNHKAKGTVDWANNTEKVKTTFSASGTVKWTSGNNVQVKVVQMANGTANANGTALSNGSTHSGRAFKHGDWGIKGSGTALVGELGMETLVRGGRFYTIGDNGAEFIKYQQGDIIFNHKQTEELFKNGKVTSGGGRGKMFADGSAFANGSYPSSGRAFWEATASESNFASKRQKKNTSSSKKKSSSSSSSTADEFEETLDWIEIAIDRIERAIDQLDQKANNVYKSWSSRNGALTNEISKVGDEISLQQKAYERYIQEANSVGLSESYAEKVRNGTIDIETITDEDLNDKISEYQDFYEKALDCKDAIDELKETEASLYAQRFENVQTQYDAILQGYEHTESMLNEYISQAEEQGYIVSKKYYQALINNEKSNIAELKKEQADLITARDEAVASGTIKKQSEEW